MLEILRETPAWVYGAFLLTLYLGLSACVARTFKRSTVFAIPAIFTALSAMNVYMSTTTVSHSVLSWACGVFVGFIAGGIIFSGARVTLIDGGRFRIAGSPHLLVVLLIYFGLRYWMGYHSAVDHEWAKSQEFLLGRPHLDGICSGLFCGRAAAYLYSRKRLLTSSAGT